MNMKISLEDKLSLDELAYQVVYSYAIIERDFDDFELRRGIVNWKKEIFPIIQLQENQFQYVLKILSLESSKAYLEVLNMRNEYKQEQFNSIKPIFKPFKENKNEEIHTQSKLRIW